MAQHRKPALPAVDHQGTIDRLRQIAAQSADSLLVASGAPHPDAKLLGDIAAALRIQRIAQQYEVQFQEAFDRASADARDREDEDAGGPWEPPFKRPDVRAAFEEAQGWRAESRKMLRAAGKIPARTGAGIYAKALIVRESKTGAAILAMSLAADLVANTELRAALWPAEAVSL
jgi:hypothetical protein